jgi:hypothetical protein
VQQDHARVLGVHPVERGPDRGVSLHSRPPVKAIFAPAGSITSVSARRRAAMKSRLSITAEVSAFRLTSDP